MAYIYWKSPGILDGRVEPCLMGFEDWYYIDPDYYANHYVFCLGEDNCYYLPSYMLKTGDEISVEQIVDLTAYKLITFTWRMYMPSMPAYRVILNSKAVSVKTGALIDAADALIGLDITDPTAHDASELFEALDKDQITRCSGFPSAANNGDFRVSCVPVHTAITPAGRIAVIENAAAVAEAGPNATLEMLGGSWRAEAYAGGVLRAEMEEPPGPGWLRQSLSMHVSKLVGNQLIKFVLKLGETTA